MTARARARRTAIAVGAALLLPLGVAQAAPGGDTQGARGIGDPYYPDYGNGGYDVDHYGIHVAYRPKTDHLITWTLGGEPAPMTRSYRDELARLEARGSDLVDLPVRVRVGDTLRISAPGSKYDGLCGTLVKRGRTRFHLRIGRSVMTVPFAMARSVGRL